MRKLAIFLAILFLVCSFGFTTDYYVDATSGNNNNTGTSEGQAWQTIGKVNSEMSGFNAGDNIYFKKGETWTDATLTITEGGSGGTYITFTSYGTGARPCIDGQNSLSHLILSTDNSSYLHIEGFELKNFTGTGIGFVSTNRTNIIIRDCHVHNGGANGIILRQIDTYEVSGCTVHDTTNSGIGMIGTAPGTTQITNGKILSNTCYNFDTNDGIAIHRSDEGYECGANHYFYDNECYNANEDGLDVTSGTYIILRGNRTYDNDGKSFLIGTVVAGDRYVWIEDHYSKSDDKRAAYFGAQTKITMIHSVFWNPYGDRVFDFGGSASVDDMYIFNNTFVGDTDSAYDLLRCTTSACDNLIFKNNIFLQNYDKAVDLVDFQGGGSPANTNSVFDNNCWYHADGNASAARWNDDVSGLLNWADWKSVYSLEANGMFDDPELTNIAGEDFSLQSTSPCINTGTWVTTITSANGSGTSFVVANPHIFHDGLGLTTGSVIQLEDDSSTVTVTEVNYGTSTVTVSESVSWTQNDGISFGHSANLPDIGAEEYVGGDVGVTVDALSTTATTSAPAVSVITGGGAWQTAWDPALDTEEGSGARNYRQEMIANTSSYSGTKIRITITAGPSGTLVLNGSSIGLMTTVDDMDDPANGTFKRITWDTGNSGTSVSASSSKVSDEITFDFDKTKRYGFHFRMEDQQYSKRVGGGSETVYYGASGEDDTLTQTVSYSSIVRIQVIDKLEVYVGSSDIEVSGPILSVDVSLPAPIVTASGVVDIEVSGPILSVNTSLPLPVVTASGGVNNDFPLIYIDEGCAGTHVGSFANPYDDLNDINWATGGDNSIFDYLAGSPSQSPFITLRGGDAWLEQMTVGCSGLAAYPIIIGKYGTGDNPIIDAEDTRAYCINTNSKDYIIIQQLKLKGATSANVLLSGANQTDLNYCISIDGVDGVEIGSTSSKVQNCVIYGCTSGIDVNAAGHVKNTIIRTCSDDLAETEGTAVKTTNNIEDDGDPDPLMTDPASGDFTLQSSSPCIDAGTDLGLTEDYAGNPVPNPGGIIIDILKPILKPVIIPILKSVGGIVDIGAYEKQ